MLKIEIIPMFENAKDYIKAVEQNKEDIHEAWQKYMVEPFWKLLSAPWDFMKPAPIQNINALKEQVKILSRFSLDDLLSKFNKITEMLDRGYDDEPLLVALYPADDNDTGLKERENGVRGCGPGNVVITINPFAQNYYDWIPYIFAHEYHHCVVGCNWWLNKIERDGTFLEYLLIEGQADFFAESIFPDNRPQWTTFPDNYSEEMLWEKFKPILFSTDQQIHGKFMFGDEAENLPWCIGYVFGRLIVGDYMRQNPNISFIDLIHTKPIDILNASRFKT